MQYTGTDCVDDVGREAGAAWVVVKALAADTATGKGVLVALLALLSVPIFQAGDEVRVWGWAGGGGGADAGAEGGEVGEEAIASAAELTGESSVTV